MLQCLIMTLIWSESWRAFSNCLCHCHDNATSSWTSNLTTSTKVFLILDLGIADTFSIGWRSVLYWPNEWFCSRPLWLRNIFEITGDWRLGPSDDGSKLKALVLLKKRVTLLTSRWNSCLLCSSSKFRAIEEARDLNSFDFFEVRFHFRLL